MSISRLQLTNLLKFKPLYTSPQFQSNPYVGGEQFVGTVVDYSPATTTAYPKPTSTFNVSVGNVTENTSYILQTTDIGKQIKITQESTNSFGNAVGLSNTSIITDYPTFSGLNLLGVNCGLGTASTAGYFFYNAAFDGRGFGVQGTGVAGNIALDVNGWPAQACELVISSPRTSNNVSVDGQLAAGTYNCSFKSVGQSTTVSIGSGTQGFSLTNIVNQADGVTTTFTITLAAAATATLNFSGAIQYLDIPRGATPSANRTSPFADEVLAYWSQFPSIRFMDFLFTNVRKDVNWSDRPVDYPQIPQRGNSTSWEWVIRFINDLASYQNSKLKRVWLNISGHATSAYATSLAQLLNTFPLNTSIEVWMETGNEAWNPGFALYVYYRDTAFAETNCISNYAVVSPVVSSCVGDGNNATVTLTTSLPSYITNTALMFAGCSDGTFLGGTPTTPVNVVVTGSNTFTYPCSTSGNITGKNWAGYFNTTSNLVSDGAAKLSTSANAFYLPFKYYVRQAYIQQQAWVAVRPQDKWILGLQLNGGSAQGGNNYPPVHLPYAAHINGGSANWLHAAAIAPYVAANNTNLTVSDVLTTLNGTHLTTIEQEIRSHIWNCNSYGIRPVAYEGGPDIQAVPSLQYAVSTDPGIGTFVTTLLDSWFKNGGQEFHFYTATPGCFTDNNAQGAWSALQKYSDTTSPKIAAILNYSTKRDYANIYGSPGDFTITYYQAGNGNINNTSGLYYWNGNTTLRNIDFIGAFPRSRRYLFTVYGTESISNTNTLVNVYLDGVLIGQSTMPNKGDGSNSGSTGTAVIDPFKVEVAAGAHIISLQFPTLVGKDPGILKVSVIAA